MRFSKAFSWVGGLAAFGAFGLVLAGGIAVLNGHAHRTASRPSPNVPVERGEGTDSPDRAFEWRRKIWLDEKGHIPSGALPRALAQKQAILDSSAQMRIAGDYWIEMGPDNTSGRNRAILIHPTNPSVMWQGSEGGGVWKTTDGGATWNPISDSFGNLAVGAMAMDPANPNVLYAGTGEGWFNGDALQGVGIYKSTDGGSSWTLLSNTAGFGNVNTLAVCPTNSNIVLAGTQYGGIRRSPDGGSTWLTVEGAQSGQSLAFSTGNPNNVIAGLQDYDFGLNHWYTVIAYSSDAGATWTRSNTRVDQFDSDAVTFAGASSTLCFASGPDSSGAGTCYKSTDAGHTWSAVGSFSSGSSSWYNNGIWVDPTNPNLIVICDTHVWRSSNGGASFTDISSNGYLQTTIPHPDVHAVVAAPGYNGTTNRQVFFCTDGGSYSATDITSVSGTSNTGWNRLDRNARTTQYYAIAGDGGTGRIAGGLQDNGTLVLPSGSTQAVWPFGGDGGSTAIDYTDPNYVYGEYVDLQIWRATSGGTSQGSGSYITSGLSDAGSHANFIAPFVMDPNTPTTLIAGGSSLWRCTNAKAGTPTWSSIKPPLGSGTPISAVAVAKGNSNLIWVANNDGEVYKTTNGTAGSPTWTTIDDNGATNPLPNRYVTSILIDKDNSSVVYVTFGGFSANNVWKTSDGGTTWTSITGNLPQAPVHTIARNPSSPSTLYVGTEIGLFSTSNGGATWTVPSDMVANAPVFDLKYMNNSSTLVAGTHGRGAWMLTSQTLAGHVTLNSYIGDVTQPTLVVDILDNTNAVVQTSNVQLDSSGNFQLKTAVDPGVYSVRIKGQFRFLRKLIPNVTFTVAGASGISASLTNGDVNGDNVVSLADFAQLRAAFGSSAGGPNWNPNADLNGDGTVSLADFGILRSNFGKSGD